MKRSVSIRTDLIALLVGTCVRAIYSFHIQYSLNWDEAPQVLMARQISLGQLFPFVHFQLPYIGAVEQYPLALFMFILGPEVFTVRLFYFLVSTLSLVIAFYLYRRILPPFWSSCALGLMALCPPIILLCSLQSYSFGGLILFESVVLVIAFSIRVYRHSIKWLAVFGIVNGLALYNNVLFLGILLFCSWSVYQAKSWRGMGWFAGGMFIGYFPMLLFNLLNNFISFQMLVSKYLIITQAKVNESGIFDALINGFAAKATGQTPNYTIQHLYGYPRFFQGPGHAVQYTAFIAILILVILGIATLLPHLSKNNDNIKGYLSHNQLPFYLVTALTGLSAISEMRYMTALVPLVPVIVCQGLMLTHSYSNRLAQGLYAFLLVYLLLGHYKALEAHHLGDRPWLYQPFEAIYKALNSHGLQYGYGSHPFQATIAFLSGERIKISPQIGPMYIDKLPHYSQAVDAEQEIFFIIPTDSTYLAPLADRNITYQLDEVEGWWILWDLSQRIYPIDLLSADELSRADGYKRWSYRKNPKVLNQFRGGH